MKTVFYTKGQYEESKYIFVCENYSSHLYQYSMIYWKYLWDDNGNPFGFNTHLFWRTYGSKLTEMHLEDYTIDRLLGHMGTGFVNYYIKLSNGALEKNTKEICEEVEVILLDLIKEWEDYGEV